MLLLVAKTIIVLLLLCSFSVFESRAMRILQAMVSMMNNGKRSDCDYASHGFRPLVGKTSKEHADPCGRRAVSSVGTSARETVRGS